MKDLSCLSKRAVSKLISTALALLMIVPLLTACGGGGERGNADTLSSASAAAETAAGAESEAGVPAMSELKDFKGQTFTFLTRDGEWLGEFNVAEANGDIENDAVYTRNLATEEKYNVKFTFDAHVDDWAHHSDFDNLIHNSVLAGDALYDAVAGYQCCLTYNTAWGDLLDLMKLPYFEFSSKWWSEQMIDTLSVNGRLFYAGGDITKSAISGLCCLLFNKKLAQDYKITGIYDLVREKKWTHDTMMELVKGTYQDVNGDGTKDVGDVYGYAPTDYSIRNYCVSYETPTYDTDKDGKLKLVWNTQHTYDVVEKLVTMTKTDDVYFNLTSDCFTEGRVLFYGDRLSSAQKWREMEDDFGIIPFPMYDEKQGRYLTSVANSASMIAIMVTAKSPENSAYIIEAMCRESMTTIRPAIFEGALKSKYSRDEDSSEMIEIIRDAMAYDVGWANSLILGVSGAQYTNMVKSGDINFASWYAAQESSLIAKLAEFSEAYYN